MKEDTMWVRSWWKHTKQDNEKTHSLLGDDVPTPRRYACTGLAIKSTSSVVERWMHTDRCTNRLEQLPCKQTWLRRRTNVRPWGDEVLKTQHRPTMEKAMLRQHQPTTNTLQAVVDRRRSRGFDFHLLRERVRRVFTVTKRRPWDKKVWKQERRSFDLHSVNKIVFRRQIRNHVRVSASI